MKTTVYMLDTKFSGEELTDKEFIQHSIDNGWQPLPLQDFIDMWNNNKKILYLYIQSTCIRIINEISYIGEIL